LFARVLHAQVPQVAVDGELTGTASEQGTFQAQSPGLTAPRSEDEGAEGDFMHRYKPVANLWELGIFVGPLFISDGNSFRGPGTANPGGNPTLEPFSTFKQPAGEIGLRAAYFPFSFVGAEIEGMVAAAETDDDTSVAVLGGRGHVMLQSPFWSLVPFVLGGVGYWGVLNDESGNDTDPAFHYGGGAKLNVSEMAAIRLDIRDTVTNRRAIGDYPHSIEVLVGGGLVLGRDKKEAKDTDLDGMIDERDQCPLEAGTLPNGCPIRDTDADSIMDPDDQCPLEAGPLPTGCPVHDADEDGVVDASDQCINEKGVAPTGCPDGDLDGVFDQNDKCPALPGVPPDGCLPDPDGDGFVGADDHCPDEAETKNFFQDKDGCPDEIPEAVKSFMGVIKGIEFDTNKADIRPGSQSVLDQAFSVLEKYPDLRVEIIGHTDNTGALDHNLDLSHRRAASVKSHLVGQGIDPKRIQARGAGPNQPLGSNGSLAGRQQNRRIEFQIIE
jgi:outer membrane protein OmpA-like peptidoglycan-associated protein